MKYFPILALALFFLSQCTYTQKVRDGKFAWERKQYAVAVDLLSRELKKAKTSSEKAEKAFLLGESYKNLNEIAEAANWYKAAYDYGYGVDALREYAYALKATEQYADAMQAFKDLGIEIGSPYEYRKEVAACRIAAQWAKEKSNIYTLTFPDFNSAAADYSPAFYEHHQLVFTSDRPTATGEDAYKWTGREFSDLFVADLASGIVQPFDNQINTPNNEGTAVFNADFSEIIFTRCSGAKKEDYFCQLMSSKRSGEGWTTPQPLPFIQPGVNYGHPALSADGQTLYFACNSKEGWGGYDIWTATRTDEGWSEPTLMSRSINTPYDEKFPTVDHDTLYFSSNGHTGMGGLDIFKSYRLANGAWTPPQNLKPPINSGGDDFGYIIDYQAKRKPGVLQVGYFTSTRAEGSGSDDIIQFERRTPPPEPEKPEPKVVEYRLILEGYVLEKIYETPDDPNSKYLGRRPLNGATVIVESGQNKQTFEVGQDGFFTMDVAENTDYRIQASKAGYLSNETVFSTKGVGRDPNNPVQTFEVEIILDPILVDKEIVLEDIYYDFDKWDIRADARPSLDRLANMLKLNPDITIQLGSHTDCRGNNRYNEELSQKRAQAAVNYLIEKGIASERLVAKGYGESQPKVDCVCSRCTEEEHQLNRRTTFRILNKGFN